MTSTTLYSLPQQTAKAADNATCCTAPKMHISWYTDAACKDIFPLTDVTFMSSNALVAAAAVMVHQQRIVNTEPFTGNDSPPAPSAPAGPSPFLAQYVCSIQACQFLDVPAGMR